MTIQTDQQLDEFVDYVFSFYGEGGIYPMGANRTVVRNATNDIIKIARIKGEEFCGDSIDRELVRDLLISKYNLK
jgi:hypothetical protein